MALHSACRFPLISTRLKRFNNLLCALSISELHGEFPICLRIIKPFLRRKLVDTPAQQSVKQANGAFGQFIAKTAQEFRLSLGLIRRQSQRFKSADLTAFFWQYAIFSHTLSNDGAHVFLCLDPIFASALIEVQTISFVTGMACVDRAPSVTGRALIPPFLDKSSEQCALADVLPRTEARPRFEEGAAALEIQLAKGVFAWLRERSGCRAVI